MTAEQQIFAALSPLVAVFPEHLPVATTLPALVFQRVGGVDDSTNCESGFVPEMRLGLFCETPAQRADLVAQIQQVAQTLLWLNEDVLIYEYDYNTKAYCAIWSYLIDE